MDNGRGAQINTVLALKERGLLPDAVMRMLVRPMCGAAYDFKATDWMGKYFFAAMSGWCCTCLFGEGQGVRGRRSRSGSTRGCKEIVESLREPFLGRSVSRFGGKGKRTSVHFLQSVSEHGTV